MSRDYNKIFSFCQGFLELFLKIFLFFVFCVIISHHIGVFMKILFSPSEDKTKTGSKNFELNKLTFNSFDRTKLLKNYHDFVTTASLEELSKLFGLKKEKDIKEATVDIFSQPVSKAVEKYNGVAYEYLKYHELSSSSKKFIDTNVIIFSNLFGFLLAGDMIPYYRLKQGEKLDGFDLPKFYKENFSDEIDDFLEGEFVVDLRAKYYEKYYTLKVPHITCKFLKNGKVISHWAKAYRGILLKDLSKAQPQDEEQFASIEFENLVIKEITKKKNIKEYVFEIV